MVVLLLWTNNLNVINIIVIFVNNSCRDIRTFGENLLNLNVSFISHKKYLIVPIIIIIIFIIIRVLSLHSSFPRLLFICVTV